MFISGALVSSRKALTKCISLLNPNVNCVHIALAFKSSRLYINDRATPEGELPYLSRSFIIPWPASVISRLSCSQCAITAVRSIVGDNVLAPSPSSGSASSFNTLLRIFSLISSSLKFPYPLIM